MSHEESDYVGLTYDEIRAKNIERNERFLKEILGFNSYGTKENDDINDNNEVDVDYKGSKGKRCDIGRARSYLDHALRDERERATKVLNFARIPSLSLRKDELDQMLIYLDRNFQPAPALVVCGPTGSGKTHCCKTCLTEITDVPSVIINCTGFSNSKDLIRECFTSIQRSITNFRSQNGLNASTLSDSQNKLPSSFGDFACSLKSLLNSDDFLWASLIILFDSFDAVDKLEPDLSSRLLSLSQLSHHKIKILATSRLLSSKKWSCMFLPFRPYSDAQIVDILIGKANQLFPPSNASSQVYMKLLTHLIREATPRLLLRTRHISDMWEEVLALCKFTINNVKKKDDESTTTISLPPNSTIGAVTQSILQLPAARLLCEDDDDDMKYRNKIMRKSYSNSFSSSSSSSSINGSLNDDANEGLSKMGCEKIQHSLEKFERKIMKESLQATQWHYHLSLSMKYLLVAAFLASNNPKESDAHTFGTYKRGKKKKTRIGQEEDESENTSMASSRSFSLDRLLSIFSQILSIGGNIGVLGGGDIPSRALGRSSFETDPHLALRETFSTYGDANIFASVSFLVEQKFLFNCPASTIDHPTYLSSVSLGMAEQLSQALQFPLHNCMYSSSK